LKRNQTTIKENIMNALQARIQQTAVELLPDSDRYKIRFKVRSSSSNRLYLVSFDNAPGAQYWTCSCRGNIRHGQCKHLDAAGLRGRKYGHQSLAQYTGTASAIA
jgi:hypothetical protein